MGLIGWWFRQDRLQGAGRLHRGLSGVWETICGHLPPPLGLGGEEKTHISLVIFSSSFLRRLVVPSSKVLSKPAALVGLPRLVFWGMDTDTPREPYVRQPSKRTAGDRRILES